MPRSAVFSWVPQSAAIAFSCFEASGQEPDCAERQRTWITWTWGAWIVREEEAPSLVLVSDKAGTQGFPLPFEFRLLDPPLYVVPLVVAAVQVPAAVQA